MRAMYPNNIEQSTSIQLSRSSSTKVRTSREWISSTYSYITHIIHSSEASSTSLHYSYKTHRSSVQQSSQISPSSQFQERYCSRQKTWTHSTQIHSQSSINSSGWFTTQFQVPHQSTSNSTICIPISSKRSRRSSSRRRTLRHQSCKAQRPSKERSPLR